MVEGVQEYRWLRDDQSMTREMNADTLEDESDHVPKDTPVVCPVNNPCRGSDVYSHILMLYDVIL